MNEVLSTQNENRDPVFLRKSISDFSSKIVFKLDALGGSAKAPPPPRGHPRIVMLLYYGLD
jgi:hypothetical protein